MVSGLDQPRHLTAFNCRVSLATSNLWPSFSRPPCRGVGASAVLVRCFVECSKLWVCPRLLARLWVCNLGKRSTDEAASSGPQVGACEDALLTVLLTLCPGWGRATVCPVSPGPCWQAPCASSAVPAHLFWCSAMPGRSLRLACLPTHSDRFLGIPSLPAPRDFPGRLALYCPCSSSGVKCFPKDSQFLSMESGIQEASVRCWAPQRRSHLGQELPCCPAKAAPITPTPR